MSPGLSRVYDAWPNKVVIGPGAAASIGAELRAMGKQRVLLVTDGGVLGVPAVGSLLTSLRSKLPEVEVFSRVGGNPTDRTVGELVDFMEETRPEALVAVGGGSPIDAAKCANLVYTNGGRPLDYGRQGPRDGSVTEPLLPLVAVPTTAGTASEVTSTSVIVDTQRGRKVSISHPRLVPDLSILDAELTLSLPPDLTAYTGMDALTHLIEAYVSTAGFAPADGIALSGLNLLARALPAVLRDGSDVAAREDMLVASMMGGLAFNHNRLGLVHAMAHQLSSVCGLHHGLANAILLPRVMAFNLPANPGKFSAIAQALGADCSRLPVEAAGKEAIRAVEDLAKAAGIPRSLGEVGVSRDQVPAMVSLALEDTAIRRNPRPPTAADVERLYLAALG